MRRKDREITDFDEMMKSIYNRLIGNAYLIHLSTYQYERMMKGKDDTGQKRNTYFFFWQVL